MEAYTRVKVVGKGNYGFGVQVQDKENKKYYLMKVIDVTKMSKNERVQCLNEIKCLKTLKNPFINRYRESFMYNKKYLCIIMNYCCNGDLSAYLKKRRSEKRYLSEDDILYWFTQICLGLKCIHETSIIHRDLKSQNIFITGHKNQQIGDFGVSKLASGQDDIFKTLIGTPQFQAPELCNQSGYNQKADIWSLGCILYELCALKVPFDATTYDGLRIKICRGDYPGLPDKYSKGLKGMIRKCQSLDVEGRPSIQDILNTDQLQKHMIQIAQNIDNKDKANDQLAKEISDKNTQQEQISKKINIENTIAEMIEVKRYKLEQKMGLEIFSQVWNEYWNGNKDIIEEFNSEIVECFTDLVNYETFFYS